MKLEGQLNSLPASYAISKKATTSNGGHKTHMKKLETIMPYIYLQPPPAALRANTPVSNISRAAI